MFEHSTKVLKFLKLYYTNKITAWKNNSLSDSVLLLSLMNYGKFRRDARQRSSYITGLPIGIVQVRQRHTSFSHAVPKTRGLITQNSSTRSFSYRSNSLWPVISSHLWCKGAGSGAEPLTINLTWKKPVGIVTSYGLLLNDVELYLTL